MLILISPAKTLDLESSVPELGFTAPEFVSQSAALIDLLQDYSPAKLAQLMGLSDKLASLNVARNLAWSRQFDSSNSRPAIFTFRGDVYQGLDANSLTDRDLGYAQDHLRILSGLYGLLRPLDLMQPYRLEMGTRLQNPAGKDLYAFWGEQLSGAVNAQLDKLGSRDLINLASNEYFKSVDNRGLDARVISPVFKDCKNGTYKVISFYAKKARGLMARWIIQQRPDKPEQLRDFDLGGYYYAADQSSPDAPVFLRDEQG